jgi:hypothetical protein
MPLIIDKPATIISPALLKELENSTHEFGQVVIHGICKAKDSPSFIRIWPTTFLFDRHSSHISELLFFEKISRFPIWTKIPAHSEFGFTLIFGGLPASCSLFDLQEVIPQANGFHVASIMRNDIDVYYLDFSV